MTQNVSYTTQATHSYAHALATGLVHFAMRNQRFSSTLSYILADTYTRPYSPYTPSTETYILTPSNEQAAIRRARWLIEACEARRIEDHEHALATLTTWRERRPYEDPQDLPFLLGVVVGVVPLVGMGHIPVKQEAMKVFICSDRAVSDPLSYARTITTLTHRVVERGLTIAGGHTGKLEPELGDWLFGEKTLAMFRADRYAMHALRSLFESLDVPHGHESDAHGTTLLVCSPVIRVEDLPGDVMLTSLDETT